MIKNFFSRTRRSKGWRARAEKMWTTKIFEDFFLLLTQLRTRIVTQSLPTIWGRWWFWTGIKILTLGINRTNLMGTKVFCGFISKLAFEVENQAAPCTNACIIWGVKKFTNSTTFYTFWIFQIFCCNFWLNTETNYW